MNKIDVKILITTVLICLIPILVGMMVYDTLPEQMAIHFGMNNQPDSYASKEFAVFGIPSILIAFQIFCCIGNDLIENKKQNRKLVIIYKWIIPVIGIMVYLSIIGYGAGIKINMQMVACIAVGIVFTIVGNYLPKAEPNRFERKNMDREVWKKYNRPIGYSFVIIGLLFIISAFLDAIFSLIVLGAVVVLAIVITISYIYLVYKNKNNI